MSRTEDFRFKSHELLIELDAATTKIMLLVSANEISGLLWDEAVERHKVAVAAWQEFLEAKINRQLVQI